MDVGSIPAGVSVRLTRVVDVFDGVVANDVAIDLQIGAGATRTFSQAWCNAPTSHTVQSTYSGTDAFGRPVSVTSPIVVLLAKP